VANYFHLTMLSAGADSWNNWRIAHPEIIAPDLSGTSFERVYLVNANLSGANFSGSTLVKAVLQNSIFTNANLSRAILIDADVSYCDFTNAILTDAILNNTRIYGSKLAGANFRNTDLSMADFSNTDLTQCDIAGANFCGIKLVRSNLSGLNLAGFNLYGASLQGADLTGANLTKANLGLTGLTETNLTRAILTGANLQYAILVRTKVEGVILNDSKVYGVSTWDLIGTPSDESSLIITEDITSTVTVDNIYVAQFIYLLLNYKNVRNILNALTSKAVLILGRFSKERKPVLQAMANELRKYNLLPIIFDFDRPTAKDFTETIKTLAGMSLFIIADITSPKSSPLELQATVPDYQIPFVIIIQENETPFAMLRDLVGKYNWVLEPIITYSSVENLISGFKAAVIDRAWQKRQEILNKKMENIKEQSIDDFTNDNKLQSK
jgi:uncharacterized protein YjbI with pentapeptide repeats